MTVNPIPEGLTSLVPYLVVKPGAEAVEFYRQAFGAEVLSRFDGPDGALMHAQLKLGDAVLEISDPFAEMGLAAPAAETHSMVLTHWCADADAVHARAVAAGAKDLGKPELGFSGDRLGRILDPFGHRWTIATHVEDISAEEMQRRVAAMSAGTEAGA
jgi:uncharacterized glyoxalase superfamily protein PhnB